LLDAEIDVRIYLDNGRPIFAKRDRERRSWVKAMLMQSGSYSSAIV
jgi:hypothetical protein